MIDALLFQTLAGISYGMILWIVAAGLTIIFGVLKVLNFAHGSLYMLGGYFAYTFYWLFGLNFWLSVALSCGIVGAIGFVMEKFFLKRIYHLALPYQLLMTFAFILIFDDLVKMLWGPEIKMPPMPGLYQGTLLIFGRPFPAFNLFLILAGVLVAVAIWLIFEKTWWGKTVRASAKLPEMASALGINVPLLFTTVFMFGAAIAGLAGALQVSVRVIAPGVGFLFIIQAFIVTVIGGLGNLKGAFVGSLMVGVLTSLGIMFFPIFEMALAYALMAAVLLLRPQGIFGE